MDIQSVDMSQANVQEQAAVQVKTMEQQPQQQAQAVNNTIPADPSLGQNVDLTV
jgi:hypothetical protein